MKHFLQRIFFWDEPAKGVFFHATVMWAVPWCISVCLCFLSSFLLTLEWSAIEESFFWKGLLVTLFFGMPVVAVVEAVAVIVCLARLFWLQRENRQLGSSCGCRVVRLGVMVALLWLFAMAIVVAHGSCWTAYLVRALVVALGGYVCLGYWLASFQRNIIGKGVTLMWGFVAVLWIVSLGMAIPAKIASNKHCAALERQFGRPPTYEARNARIAQECRIDAEFWQKVHELLERRTKFDSDTLEDEDADRSFYMYDILKDCRNFWQLTPAELDCYRKQLADFTDLPELERMFSAPLPLLLHKDFIRLRVGDAIRDVYSFEQWRLNIALADKDMDTVMAVLGRIVNILECQTQISKYALGTGSWSFDRWCLTFIENLVASPLPTDEQLAKVKELLEKREPAYKEIQEGMAYYCAIAFNNQFKNNADDFLAGEPRPAAYSLFPLLCSVNRGYWDITTSSQWLHIYVGRFLLPQFFWFSANDQRIIFKALASFPDDLPEWNCGSLLIRMEFNYDWLDWTYYGYHMALALNRALRCAIDAVLEFRRTGAYPSSLSSPLDDPFTGEPLKYRVGECWTYDHDTQKASKIQALQVWSLGVNKRDDDGIRFTLPGDGQRKIYHRDDLRILIPLPGSDQ